MLKNYLSKFFAVAVLCFAFANANAQTLVTVAEGENAGAYYTLDASFGPFVTAPITAPIMVVDDGVDTPSDGCTELMNDLTGSVAIVDRGACSFTGKALNAQNAGAIAVIICNNAGGLLVPGAAPDDPNIPLLTVPTVGLTQEECATLRSVEGTTVTMNVADNLFCARATPITPGTYTVDSIYQDPVFGNGNGAGTSEVDDNIDAAKWYSFTPTEDGVMSINSCLGGADTRLLVHTGVCTVLGSLESLTLEALNDDACPFEDGNEDQAWASGISRFVTAGTTYHIEWNNRWMAPNTGFSFSLDFTPQAFEAAEGEAACSAIAVGAGTFTVDTLAGFGAAQRNGFASEWYSFTLDAAQVVSISSCGATANTVVNLYSGASCDALAFVGQNNDGASEGCAPASELAEFVAEAGVTYYIEWSDVLDASGFDWTLSISDIPAVPTTFTVDMTVVGASADGVFMAGDFSGWENVAMTDNGDNTWSLTVDLTAFDTTQYKFKNGPDGWEEAIPADCTVGATGNRFVVVSQTEPLSVGTVCFNSCATCVPENCAEPLVLISEDFDGFDLGDVTVASDDFILWPGGTGSVVSDEQANSGTNSVKIEGGGSEDILLTLGDRTGGHYYLSWDMYIPAERGAYFNMQHLNNPGDEFAFQVTLDPSGVASMDNVTAGVATFDFPQDAWFKVIITVDQNNDVATMNVGGAYVHSWTFSTLALATDPGTNQISHINFFPLDATNLYYIDNVLFQQIPEATEGQYCATARTATEGNNLVQGNEGCFGGGLNVSTTNVAAGAGAVWYSYVPAEDGVISVSSCGSESDSRLWIVQGDCAGYAIVGANDDQCAQSNGDAFASLRDVVVTGGEQYYIVWDNRWDANDFAFDLTFSTDLGAPGELPQTAIPVTPGEYEIESITGNSTVGNELLGSFTTSLTLYGQSKWYVYTPAVDEVVTISSCDGAGNDNVVVVHTGTLESLTSPDQVAIDDNSCANGVSAEVVDLALTGGTSYLIEWIVRSSDDDAPFIWTLSGAASAVDVTFNVDGSSLGADLAADGIFLAGAFNGFNGEAMTDNGDGTFSATVLLEVGESYTYKYQNGAGNFETVTGDCTVGAFGDREVTVGEEAASLDIVCYSFCTDCATDVVDHEFDAAFSVFPNPAKDLATVSFELAETTDVQVQVINSLGQVLQSNVVKNASNGTLELNLTNLAAGIYTVTMTDGTRFANETLVVE
ncbi:MAG: PA domain-containing protein [Saprospiraceae bacterium]